MVHSGLHSGLQWFTVTLSGYTVVYCDLKWFVVFTMVKMIVQWIRVVYSGLKCLTMIHTMVYWDLQWFKVVYS